MTSQHDKPKRWRLRFSVRTLIVVVTLVCCYAACWGPTKRQGVAEVLAIQTASSVDQSHGSRIVSILVLGEEIRDVSARLPLLIRVTHHELTSGTEHYYFWFFGYVAKLAFERDVTVPPSSALEPVYGHRKLLRPDCHHSPELYLGAGLVLILN